MDRDIEYMRQALALAEQAANMGEVPVGALVVDNASGEVISSAYNLRETNKSSTAHAEILAIEEACRKRGGWRLGGCTLYVTLEPCPMCAGAIVNSRIVSVVYGASDKKAGAFGTLFDMNTFGLNHKPQIVGGVMERECAALLSDFFAVLRERRKNEKIAKKIEK